MKTKNIVLLGTLIVLSITACKDEPTPKPYVPSPGYHAAVIKFDKPEYKEHIMVYADGFSEGTTRLCAERFALPDSVIHICGKSPYIELPQDYLLIDWKWDRIYYQNNEAIIHEKWSELKTADDKWPIEDIYVTYPVKEAYYLDIEDMKAYNGGTLEYDSIRGVGGTVSESAWAKYSDEEKEQRLIRKNMLDSAQAYFAEVISNMIQDGKLPESARVELKHK